MTPQGFKRVLAVVVVAGCATVKEPERARFTVDARPISEPGPRCGQAVSVRHGAVPVGARENVRYHVTVSMPVALGEVEALISADAEKACADGVMILQAVAADGAIGVTEVTAAAFVVVEER
ncbi:MAG: hypothetical protein Q8O67_09115 [Deltaproteobacteria bacterium]|nr:hypothetical protein [Deltaproteobacteria bacterium]